MHIVGFYISLLTWSMWLVEKSQKMKNKLRNNFSLFGCYCTLRNEEEYQIGFSPHSADRGYLPLTGKTFPLSWSLTSSFPPAQLCEVINHSSQSIRVPNGIISVETDWNVATKSFLLSCRNKESFLHNQFG